MSSLHFNNSGSGYGFSGDMSVIFPSAPVPSSASSSTLLMAPHQPSLCNNSTFGSEKSDIPFQILNPVPMRTTNDEGDHEGYFGDEKKSLSLKLGEEVEANNSGSAATEKAGHTKLCVRGHWRPAEDAKLKELVAQFGPQNWNNIAEHLQGRSGIIQN